MPPPPLPSDQPRGPRSRRLNGMMLAAEGLGIGQVERHASVSQFDDMISDHGATAAAWPLATAARRVIAASHHARCSGISSGDRLVWAVGFTVRRSATATGA